MEERLDLFFFLNQQTANPVKLTKENQKLINSTVFRQLGIIRVIRTWNRINRSQFRIHLKNSITSLFAFRRLTGIFPDRSERDFEIELPLPFCEMYWNWLFMSAIHCDLVSNKRIEFLLAYTIQKEFFQSLFFCLIDGGDFLSPIDIQFPVKGKRHFGY